MIIEESFDREETLNILEFLGFKREGLDILDNESLLSLFGC